MKKRGSWTNLLGLGVFTLFALCLLLVLLTGAGTYRRLTEAGEKRHTARIAAQYAATRVRQAQTVSLEPFGEGQALVLGEEVDGEVYLTRVYCWEGWLRELYSSAEACLSPEDGEKLMEISALAFSLDDEVLTVETEGQTILLALRTGRQVGP